MFGTSRDPREGLRMIKILKKNFVFCFTNYMFTIEIKDGHEAPLKPSPL